MADDYVKQTGKRVVKAIQLLTDPEPQFVSLVTHAASQTPFKVIKTDGELEPNEVVVAGAKATVTETDNDGETSMSKKQQADARTLVVRSSGTAEAGLQRLEFDGGVFASDTDVRTYLASKGYEGGNIEKTDSGYQVVAAPAEQFTSVSAIKGDDGVTRHVGALATVEPEPEDDGEEVKDAVIKCADVLGSSGNAELVKRYDSWMASYYNADAKTIAGVMSAGVDGLPPGIYELNDAFYAALRNLLLSRDVAGVTKLTAEFGAMIVQLVSVFDFATMPAEVVQKMVGEEPKEKASKSTGETAPAAVDLDALAAQTAELVLKQLGELGISSDSLKLVAKSASENTEVAAQQAEKVGELTQQVATLSEAVTKAELPTLQEQMTDLVKRMQTVEQSVPVSRALDPDAADLTSQHSPDSGRHNARRSQNQNRVTDDVLARNELGLG